MTERKPQVFLCNGASDRSITVQDAKLNELEYRREGGGSQNISLNLPDFAHSVGHISDRLLDLLELSVYIHAADRLIRRGAKDAVEYHGWHRSFEIAVKVRDYEFWNSAKVKKGLSAAVEFMTGDQSYVFRFEPGHGTPRTGLFDDERFAIAAEPDSAVTLFSGGLDSLTGALELLESITGTVFLVSHASNPATKRTQRKLVSALKRKYPNRLRFYVFESHLTGGFSAQEETQRTRTLLFSSIGFALAQSIGVESLHMYENGVTSLNFPKRQGLMHARASRTTHPKTMTLLNEFLQLVGENEFSVVNPFFFETKTDVVKKLLNHREGELFSSTVSCGTMRSRQGFATHCGGCNQCVDRRFAAFAAHCSDRDNSSLYADDFVEGGLPEGSKRSSLTDFLRQAKNFKALSPEEFSHTFVNELTEIVEYLPDNEGNGLSSSIEKVHDLSQRHGEQVWQGYDQMHRKYFDPNIPNQPGSVFRIVGQDIYHQAPSDVVQYAERLRHIEPGKRHFRDYELLMEDIIKYLFYPDLVNPKSQVLNKSGRQRTDSTFRIEASNGFWYDVKLKYGNFFLAVEYKNTETLVNSDFDQIARRLNKNKGQFGLICSRDYRDSDLESFGENLKSDKLTLPIKDEDVFEMLRLKQKNGFPEYYLAERLRDLLERFG